MKNKFCFQMLNGMLDANDQHRFQIFKKVGVKFYDLFLLTERPQRNLDFSEIFNIFRLTVVLFFFKNSKKICEEYLELS